jgi:hypothetical protein
MEKWSVKNLPQHFTQDLILEALKGHCHEIFGFFQGQCHEIFDLLLRIRRDMIGFRMHAVSLTPHAKYDPACTVDE